MNLKSVLFSDRRVSTAVTFVFLPWIIAAFFASGTVYVAVNLFLYGVLIAAVGYGIIYAALPRPARSQAIFLAPALGILALSGFTALWLRLPLPLIWVPTLWLGLFGIGTVCFWKDRTICAKTTVPHVGTLTILSLVICGVFFFFPARKDAVLQANGSFNWIYADTEHFYSIASSIRRDELPPKSPGTATADLLYHFGPYAPAAVISRIDGLELGDALVRVTRGASICALVLSCFGLGTMLSSRVNEEKFGGIATVAGLFFYGSILSLFTDERNSSSYVTGAILFKIPGVEVLADGGPFSHLLLGHSVLHGLGAITAIMGLCLIESERGGSSSWRGIALLALPALAVPVNSVAALYCLGIVGILLFWRYLGSARSWMSILLMVSLFWGAWHIMGYSHASDAAMTTINTHPATQWWMLTVGFIVGLGFRIMGFRWISKPLLDPLAALVLVSVLGLLTFNLLLIIRDGNQRYGIYYLQCMFSIFAFSRVTPGCWRSSERSKWAASWFRLAKLGMVLLTISGISIGVFARITRSHTGVDSFGVKLLLCAFSALFLVGVSELMKRDASFSNAVSAVLIATLSIGFLAWVTPWLNFGMGRMKMDVSLAPGEVRGLNRLRELDSANERFATNKHSVESLASNRERSYGYVALSERPVLLEGYLERGETLLPWFETLLHDNDLMFTTSDPGLMYNTAKTWQVHWLVARPGTDIALPRPLPGWLVEQQDCGDLKIYRVNY